jgi:hypothetical protein
MSCGTQYQIFDESGDLMRIVSRKEEALALIGLRSGWSYKRTVVKKVNNFKFEEALF